jgi:hypothetical protein
MGIGPSDSLREWAAGFQYAVALVPIYFLRPLAARAGNSPVAGSVFVGSVFVGSVFVGSVFVGSVFVGSVFVGSVKYPSITAFYPCRASPVSSFLSRCSSRWSRRSSSSSAVGTPAILHTVSRQLEIQPFKPKQYRSELTSPKKPMLIKIKEKTPTPGEPFLFFTSTTPPTSHSTPPEIPVSTAGLFGY